MFKKMPHKNVDSQPGVDRIHKTGVKGQARVRGCEPVWEKLFASLDQFGQTNLNCSHSNEPIRKYTMWPLNPKYLHLLRSSSVQHWAQRIVSAHAFAHAPAAAAAAVTPQLQRGSPAAAAAAPTTQGQFRGRWLWSSSLQVPSNPARSGCRVHIRLGGENKANQYKNYNQIHLFLSAVCISTTYPSACSEPALPPFSNVTIHNPLVTPLRTSATAIHRGVLAEFWQLEKGKLTLHQH